MKNFLLALLLLAGSIPLLADNLVQNGDFSQGTLCWQGDGLTPAGYAKAHPGTAANPLAPPDPFFSKGVTVPLQKGSWTRIFQDLTANHATQFAIVVTYKIAPGTTLSQKPDDYTDIGNQIEVPGFDEFKNITCPVGQFVGTIGDPDGRVAMQFFAADLKSSDVQTYQHSYAAIPASESKTFAVAFPPGHGAIVILSVVVTSK